MTKLDIVYGALLLLLVLVTVWIAFDVRERWFMLGGVQSAVLIVEQAREDGRKIAALIDDAALREIYWQMERERWSRQNVGFTWNESEARRNGDLIFRRH